MKATSLFIVALVLSPLLAADDLPSPANNPSSGIKDGGPYIGQSLFLELTQSALAQAIRGEGPVNADNWMALPEWSLPMAGTAEWNVNIAQRLKASLSPSFGWNVTGGSYSDGSLQTLEAQEGRPDIGLDRMETRLSVREWGLEALFGKLSPRYGTNYLPPLSAIQTGATGDSAKGLWMGGAFLAIGDYSLEAYCQTDPAAIDAEGPIVVAAASALLGVHEAGLIYRRENGSCFGAWYRGQVGEGLIPYAEFMVRETGDFIDVEGLGSRGIGWNADALAGLGYSPEGLNLSAYLEYRFRQAGYAESDWESLRGLPPPEQAAIVKSFPRLQSSIHALGLRLMNADEIDGLFTWSLTAIYLAPDGLYAEANAQASLFDWLSLGAKASCALLLGSEPGSADSEIAFWPLPWRFSLYASWKINAAE